MQLTMEYRTVAYAARCPCGVATEFTSLGVSEGAHMRLEHIEVANHDCKVS